MTDVDAINLRISQCFQRFFDTCTKKLGGRGVSGVLQVVDSFTTIVIANNTLKNDARTRMSWNKGYFPRAHLRWNRDNIGINNHGTPLI